MIPRVVCSHYRLAPVELVGRLWRARCLDCGAELPAVLPTPAEAA